MKYMYISLFFSFHKGICTESETLSIKSLLLPGFCIPPWFMWEYVQGRDMGSSIMHGAWAWHQFSSPLGECYSLAYRDLQQAWEDGNMKSAEGPQSCESAVPARNPPLRANSACCFHSCHTPLVLVRKTENMISFSKWRKVNTSTVLINWMCKWRKSWKSNWAHWSN